MRVSAKAQYACIAMLEMAGNAQEPQLFQVKRAVIVGLTLSADRLIEIRRNRLSNLREDRESAYEAIRASHERFLAPAMVR